MKACFIAILFAFSLLSVAVLLPAKSHAVWQEFSVTTPWYVQDSDRCQAFAMLDHLISAKLSADKLVLEYPDARFLPQQTFQASFASRLGNAPAMIQGQTVSPRIVVLPIPKVTQQKNAIHAFIIEILGSNTIAMPAPPVSVWQAVQNCQIAKRDLQQSADNTEKSRSSSLSVDRQNVENVLLSMDDITRIISGLGPVSMRKNERLDQQGHFSWQMKDGYTIDAWKLSNPTQLSYSLSSQVRRHMMKHYYAGCQRIHQEARPIEHTRTGGVSIQSHDAVCAWRDSKKVTLYSGISMKTDTEVIHLLLIAADNQGAQKAAVSARDRLFEELLTEF